MARITRTQAYLALNRVRSIGPIRARKLVAAFGSAEAVLDQSLDALASVEGIPRAAAQNVVD